MPRAGLLAAALLLPIALVAAPADAALKKYKARHSAIIHSTNVTPTTFILPAVPPDGDFGLALVDDAGPVLKQLTLPSDDTSTTEVPQLSGFIFTSRKYTEGPGPVQTGVSGSTASQIKWGTMTGWAISGSNWCNSEPATICVLAGDTDDATGDSSLPSPFYDIGTWIFHGTGFTSEGFVWSRFTNGNPGGNFQYIVRGGLAQDGTVPALPLAGLGVLALCVAGAGAAALARRRARAGQPGA